MLQVRWQLNGATASKKKTLACDYNPILKRLRDFGNEAQELEHTADGAVAKPQEKGKKKAGDQAVKAEPPCAAGLAATDAPSTNTNPASNAVSAPKMSQPVTLQSIVAELEAGGLLNSLEQPPISPSKGESDAAAPTAEKPRELSLGAANLLSAAGLLPDNKTTAATNAAAINAAAGTSAAAAAGATDSTPVERPASTSDVGAELAPASSPAPSEAGSSFEGSTSTDCSDCLDPLTLLQEPDSAAAAPAAAPLPDVARADSLASLSSAEVAQHNEGWDAELLKLSPSTEGPGLMLDIQHETEPSSKPASVHGDASSHASSPEPPSPPKSGGARTEEEEEALLFGLNDQSESLLSELHGLYDIESPLHQLPRALEDGASTAVLRDSIDANDLLLSLEPEDDKANLLHELSALPETPSGPLHFGGFDLAHMQDLAPKAAKKTAGNKKKRPAADASASKESKEPTSDGEAAAQPQPRPVKKAKPAPAPKVEEPLFNKAPEGILPPAPNSQTKFLPGAVMTPAHPATKHGLAASVKSGPSLGRTFSWQPIKFPVYK